MPNIIAHNGNTNQNYNELPPHPCNMATMKKETSGGKDVEKLTPLCTAARNVKWCSYYENSMTVPPKILKWGEAVREGRGVDIVVQQVKSPHGTSISRLGMMVQVLVIPLTVQLPAHAS